MKVPGRQLFQSWVDIGEREPGVAGAALLQPQAMVEIPFGDCAARVGVRNGAGLGRGGELSGLSVPSL